MAVKTAYLCVYVPKWTVVCWQSNSSVLSLYISVIHSLVYVVGIKQLLADSAMNRLLERVVRPAVCCSLFFV